MQKKTYEIETGLPKAQARRRFVAWLGLALLSFNILAGILLPQPSLAGQIGPDYGHVSICTAAGMFAIDPSGKQTPAKQTIGGNSICVFCLPLMHGGVDAPTSQSIADVSFGTALIEFASAAAPDIFSARFAGTQGPRAPPRLIS